MEKKYTRVIVICLSLAQFGFFQSECSARADEVTHVSAVLNASYKMDDILPIWRQLTGNGIYGKGALIDNAQGYLYYIPNEDWCKPFSPQIPSGFKSWIALIERGNCDFRDKILNAKAVNASAVVVFDNSPSTKSHGTIQMSCYRVGIVAVSITKHFGLQLASVLTKSKVFLQIEVGNAYRPKRNWEAGKTSVLFVLVSFILLMCISLAWLVFYYVQRFRYFYARDKKEKQLTNAAKKAIAKLKTRICEAVDAQEEQDDTCAVCLEGYSKGETLRILSCRHEFHKICVDPWLLEHRTCPICKTNILKEFGIEIPENATEREFEESATPQRPVIAMEIQEEQTTVGCHQLTESQCHDEDDHEKVTANVSSSSTDDEDSLSNSTSVLVTQEYA